MPDGEARDSQAAFDSALDDFAADLKKLHIARGRPTLDTIVSKATRGKLSRSGISEVFSGKYFPKRDYAIRLVRALTNDPQAVPYWEKRWEHVAGLQEAAESQPSQPDPASDPSTAEFDELRAKHQRLSDAVQDLQLRAKTAEARAETARAETAEARAETAEARAEAEEARAEAEEARAEADRLQQAVSRHGPGDGVALVRSWAKVRARSTGPVHSIAFHPSGRTLAAGYGDGTVIVFDADEALAPRRISVNDGTGPVHSVAFSPTGDILAAGSADGRVSLVLSEASQFTGDPLYLPRNSPIVQGPAIRSVAFGLGDILAAGDAEGTIHVWQCQLDGESHVSSQQSHKLHFDGAVRSLAFMPHRKLLAVGTEGRDSASTANLLDFDSSVGFDEKHDMRFAGSPVTVALSQSGNLFAIAVDRTVHLKRLDASQPSYVKCDKDIQSLAFNPTAGHLAVCTGRTCALYRVRPGDLRQQGTIKIDPAASSLAFSPDGMLLAAGREDGVVQLYGPGVCRPDLGCARHSSGQLRPRAMGPAPLAQGGG